MPDMVTRKLLSYGFALVAALTLGLAIQPAAVAAEQAAQSAKTTTLTGVQKDYLRTEVSEYLRSLTDQIKRTLRKSGDASPELYLATCESQIRG
jgi:hypothetical protein